MAWVSSTYFQNRFDSNLVSALGFTSSTVFDQFELEARATCVAVCQHAGFSPAETLTEGTVTTGFLRKMICAVILRDGMQAKKGVRLSAQDQVALSEGLSLLDGVYNKKIPIPGMQPDAGRGLGGSRFSSSTDRPRVFDLRNTNF